MLTPISVDSRGCPGDPGRSWGPEEVLGTRGGLSPTVRVGPTRGAPVTPPRTIVKRQNGANSARNLTTGV